MTLFRTAARVGVATSVHGKVQRRQHNRWAAEDQARAAAAAAQAAAVGATAAPAAAPPAPAPAAPAVPVASDDMARRIELLSQLADLRAAGVLSEDEFAQQKARILDS